MASGSQSGDPLTPEEREELEEDLISFCDRELDLLGDIRGLNVLYAGGSAPLWVEGLSGRIGGSGSLTALDLDEELVRERRGLLDDADLPAQVCLVAGSVFETPFEHNTFDLVYSAGFFHELDVREKPVERALSALVRVTRSGGRLATSDFVDLVPAAQVEEEKLQSDLAHAAFGGELYGIGLPERLVALHEEFLSAVRWRVSPPYPIRHLDRLLLAESEPPELSLVPPETAEGLRERRGALRDLIRREGYTRPATLYIEGVVP